MLLWHLEPPTYMHYTTEKRLSKAFLPFLSALVRPHLESCVQFGGPQYKKYMDMLEYVTKMSGGWSTRCRRGEETGLFSLKKQREKEIKLLSATTYGCDCGGHGDRLSSTQWQGKRPCCSPGKSQGLSSGTSCPEGLSSLQVPSHHQVYLEWQISLAMRMDDHDPKKPHHLMHFWLVIPGYWS